MRISLGILATTILGAGLLAQSPLTTTFAGGNSGGVGGAVYFDLTAQTALNVTGIDVNLNTAASTPGTVEIYMCPTTYLGSEANASAWTLVGSGTVVSAGLNAVSSLTLAAPFQIPQGTNGFAYVGIGQAFGYTNGPLGPFSTAELQLDGGSALNVAFSGTPFTPRVVNTSIYYSAGAGFASHQNIGDGCVERAAASFYEYLLPSTAMDLSNTSLTMLSAGSGYVVMTGPSGLFVPPSASATNLNLSDETDTTITFTSVFNYPGGSTSSLDITENGVVSVDSGYVGWEFTPSAFLNLPTPSWAVWHDFIPSGVNNVYWEEVGGIVYVTWLNVVGYSGTATGTTPSTFQLQFDCNTGNVTFVFESMDNVSINTWSATSDGWIVGYTPGMALDPGNTDLSALAAPIVLEAADTRALALSASARPLLGTTINLDTSNITSGAIFGGTALGFNNPMFDLTAVGMAGCTQYADHTAVILFFPMGSPTATVPFAVPSWTGLVGVDLFTQSFAYDPSAGLTTRGAVASQGLQLTLGNQ